MLLRSYGISDAPGVTPVFSLFLTVVYSLHIRAGNDMVNSSELIKTLGHGFKDFSILSTHLETYGQRNGT